MYDRTAILDTTMPEHPRLIVDVPPEQQAAIRSALERLERIGEGASAQMLIDALLTAADQSYFWTPEWQAKERAADQAIAEGRTETFGTVDAMLDFLDAQ